MVNGFATFMHSSSPFPDIFIQPDEKLIHPTFMAAHLEQDPVVGESFIGPRLDSSSEEKTCEKQQP